MTGPDQHLSTFELRFVTVDDRPDWPVVQVVVDGREAFVDDLPDWQGFDPGAMLGPQSPLLPDQPAGRRVAVYRCSCGFEGCGVIAPVIVESPDGRTMSWVDFRDYVAVFVGPTVTDVDDNQGSRWPFSDLHFDRDQYVAEVLRAAADRSWETARRKTARLVDAGLRDRLVVLPAGMELRWVSPAWSAEGVVICLSSGSPGDGSFAQHLLRLSSANSEPAEAAAEMIDRLQALPTKDWLVTFGWEPHRS